VKQLQTERQGSLAKPLVLIALLCGTFNLATSAQARLASSGITVTGMPGPTMNQDELPAAYGPDVDVHEVRTSIVSNPSAMQAQRRIP
jgi:hypothetical protein